MSTTEPELVSVEPSPTAVVRGVVAMEDLPAFFDSAFSSGLPEAITTQGVGISGPAFGAYHAQPTATVDLEVGFPTDRPIDAAGNAVAGSLPGGRVARLVHEGSFDALVASWERLMAWIAEQGLTPGTPFWEVYLTEPSPDMDPADLRTELNCPVV